MKTTLNNCVMSRRSDLAVGRAVVDTLEPRRLFADIGGFLGDLSGLSSENGGTLVPNDRIKVPVYVTNADTQRARGQIRVEFYLSTDLELDESDTLVGSAERRVRLDGVEVDDDDDDDDDQSFEEEFDDFAPVALRTEDDDDDDDDDDDSLDEEDDDLPTMRFDASFRLGSNLDAGTYYLLARFDTTSIADNLGADSFVVTASDDNGTPLTFEYGYLFGRVGSRYIKSITITNDVGDRATFSMRGNGRGSVELDNNGYFAVSVADTSDRSTLMVRANRGTFPVLAGVTGGDLRSLDAAGITLRGNINLSSVDNLTLGNVEGAVMSFASDGARLSFRQVDAAAITVDGGVRQFTANNFVGSVLGESSLSADTLDRMNIVGNRRAGIRGDLSADIRITGLGGGSDIGNLSVSGAISGATLFAQGGFGTVTAGAVVNSRLFAGVDPALVSGRPTEVVAGADIRRFTVTGRGVGLDQLLATSGVFSNSLVVADVIDQVRLGQPFLATETDAGFVATLIGNYRRTGATDSGRFDEPGVYDQNAGYQVTIV